jgi:hypothetical protein
MVIVVVTTFRIPSVYDPNSSTPPNLAFPLVNVAVLIRDPDIGRPCCPRAYEINSSKVDLLVTFELFVRVIY